uniref:Immunoglobulin V-set domain-containing protein n=1 Tax=Monopterus albus TaxID=43700 RepID=A0A3Q3JCG9_MONAL
LYLSLPISIYLYLSIYSRAQRPVKGLQLQCDKGDITAHIGGEFILICNYNANQYRYNKKYWCQGDSGHTCDILVDSEHFNKNGRRFHMVDAGRTGLFVKVTNLQFADTGVYWIGIDKLFADIMTSVNVVITEAISSTNSDSVLTCFISCK